MPLMPTLCIAGLRPKGDHKTMNKFYASVFLALTLLVAGYMPVRADRGTAFSGAASLNPGGARRMLIPSVCRTRLSATCVLCSSAGKSGILVGIEVSSGAVGSYAVAYDTGALPSVGLVGPPAASGAGALVSRQKTCEYTLATVDTNKGSCGYREFGDGVPFTNGLVICGSADVNTVVKFFENRLP